MGRQLFLHHYLPAHLASCLVTGSLIEFIFNVEPLNELDEDVSEKSKKKTPAQVRRAFSTAQDRLGGQSMLATWVAMGVILTLTIGGWYWFLPLTYGKPGLTVSQVQARRWLGYDLHFAK